MYDFFAFFDTIFNQKFPFTPFLNSGGYCERHGQGQMMNIVSNKGF